MLQSDIKGIHLLQDKEKNMFKRILMLLWLMFLVFIFLPSLSTALTGGPDKGGYSYYDSDEKGVAPFEWNEVSEDSTISIGFHENPTLVLGGPVNIGFNFKFYGNTYNKIYISKYGYITFNDGPEMASCYLQPIPTDGDRPIENSADNFIAGMWAYLSPGA